MHRIWAIIRREYVTRIKTKRFVLGTILTPLLMGLWILAPSYFASKTKGERDVVVLDQTGDSHLFEALAAQLKAAGQDATAKSRVKHLDNMFTLHNEPVPADADLDAVRRAHEAGRLGARETVLLIMPAKVLEGTAAPAYVGTTLSDPAIDEFEQAVNAAILRSKLSRAGVHADEAQRMIRAVPLKREHMKMVGRVSGEGAESVAIFMLVTMYTVTFMYGVWMMRGVATEKRSRIAEVLLTIAKPVELMSGKLFGIGLVGLTQCLIWLVAAVLIGMPGLAVWKVLGFELPRMSLQMLGYFAGYFLLGYFLYAVLFALAGASSTNTDDANHIQQPLIVLTVTPMLVFFMVLRDPNGTASVVLSLIPFFSPTIMLLRLAISNPPAWQVILSFALMAVTILVCVWTTAKAYRAGILMSGKRQTFAELVRWLRYA
jgi:ABC-2 type transport system permease protein